MFQHYRWRRYLAAFVILFLLSTFSIAFADPQPGETSSTASAGTAPANSSNQTVVYPPNPQLTPPTVPSSQPTLPPSQPLLPNVPAVFSFSDDPIVIQLKYLKADQAKSLLNLVIPDDKIRIEPVSNCLVLLCSADDHEKIDKILVAVDVPPLQVMFEAEAVEISSDDAKNIGIDWGSQTAWPGTLATGADPNSAYRIGTGKYGAYVSAVINHLIENKKGRLLASPRIAALNGNTATIMIGDKLAVEATSLNGSVSTTTVNYVDVGIKLEVTPFVNDDGTITAHIKPEVSNKTDVTKNGNPNIRTRQAETTLRVKNGETIVIGGLIQRQETSDVLKFPLLGDIPLIGQFFRSTTTEKTENELIILITPKVISP